MRCGRIVCTMDMVKNLNNDFNNNLDENFEQACFLSDKEFKHYELVEMLQSGNIPQKQIAALKFDYVKEECDALSLLNNLTGCDGKIRETVALRINQLLRDNFDTCKIFSKLSADILADASIDINANICRFAIDSADLLKFDKEFAKKYTKKIVNYASSALSEIDKFIYRDKKYVINKQMFKLYWCLEALTYFYEYADKTTLNNILAKSIKQQDYTVREKSAQVLCASHLFRDLEDELMSDENYYVRQIYTKSS